MLPSAEQTEGRYQNFKNIRTNAHISVSDPHLLQYYADPVPGPNFSAFQELGNSIGLVFCKFIK